MAFSDGVATVTGRLAGYDSTATLTATGLSPTAGHTFRCLATDRSGLIEYASEVASTLTDSTLSATVALTKRALIDELNADETVDALVSWYDTTGAIMLGAGRVPVERAANPAEVTL
jgi:hypothetical protein